MEKILEKRNLGIPATLLTFFAFFIGYGMTQSYSVILVAVLYAILVFSLQFDDKVKAAVKQSYIISFIATLAYLVMDVFDNFLSIVSPGDININLFQRAFSRVYNVGRDLINVAIIVIFIIFMIFALFRKDMKIGIVSNVLGEGTPKPKPAPQPAPQQNYQQPQQYQQYQQSQATPVQPQPIPQQHQQAAPQQYQQVSQPVYQQAPVQPAPAAQPAQAEQANRCSRCGEVNAPEAVFCATCGNKLK